VQGAAVVLHRLTRQIRATEEQNQVLLGDGQKVGAAGVSEHCAEENLTFTDGAFSAVLGAHVCGPVVDNLFGVHAFSPFSALTVAQLNR